MLVFYILFFLLFIILIFFIYKKRSRPLNKKQVNTADIHISVENKQLHKTRAVEKEAIIKEAESHFKTLSLKNPYSPLPFKVLAEFYIKNGLTEEAINKCENMLIYLNSDLNLSKLTLIFNFLEKNSRNDIVEKIELFYSE